jgi:hypothetical protein
MSDVCGASVWRMSLPRLSSSGACVWLYLFWRMSVARLLHVSPSSYSKAVHHGGSGKRVSRMPHATQVSAACRMGVHRLGKLEVLAEVQARLSQPLYAVAEKSNYLHASFKATTCMRTQDSTCMRMQTQDSNVHAHADTGVMQTQDSTCMRMQTHGCVHVCPLTLCKCVQVCVNVKSLSLSQSKRQPYGLPICLRSLRCLRSPSPPCAQKEKK